MKKEKLTYAEMLKDPRWQKRKVEILSRDNFTCQLCGDTENTLHVHHKYYLENHKPWEYDDNVLVTLCENCHKLIHENQDGKTDVCSIGELYYYEHSDFVNYCLVYYIDYELGNAFLLSVDSGSGGNSAYFEVCPIPFFSYKYVKIDDYNPFYDKDCIQNSLFQVFYKITKSFKGVSIYKPGFRMWFREEDILRYQLDTILKNNKTFDRLYKNKDLEG